MNRDEFLLKLDDFDFDSFGKDDIFDNSDVFEVVRFFANKIYDDFEKDLKEINNQVSRLKKQLAKDHHIECSCSFCKPVGEKKSCENCRHYDGTQTCNKFVARSSYNYKDFCCNKWELKC